MTATIKDVAKLAGVSFKSVSRVINKEGSVSNALYNKVQEAIKELHYQPNFAARRLRGDASSIGFVYSNPNSNYVIDMQQGIIDVCRNNDFELIIHPCNHINTQNTKLMASELKKMVNKSQVGGLILTPPMSESPKLLHYLDSQNILFVRIISATKAPNDKYPYVFLDDKNTAFAITKYLTSLGHKEIAFLAGEEEHKSTNERMNGYKNAIKQCDIKLNKNLILKGQYSFASGLSRTLQLLLSNSPPTAIFACNDEIAAGAVEAARQLSIKVPEQLSIVGFEDSPYSQQSSPKLTTARQPTYDIAKRAAEIIINLIRNKDIEDLYDDERNGFHPELIIRDSATHVIT